jgi:hypothetical protein
MPVSASQTHVALANVVAVFPVIPVTAHLSSKVSFDTSETNLECEQIRKFIRTSIYGLLKQMDSPKDF